MARACSGKVDTTFPKRTCSRSTSWERNPILPNRISLSAGIKLFREVRPLLVITDIVMPDMEGIELIRTLRQEAPNLLILAISGGSNLALYLRSATALGATAALAKPFAAGELLTAVSDLLNHAGQG